MPELPELEVTREQLTNYIQGKTISGFKVAKPYILKNYFAESLTGEIIQKIERKGKYLVIGLTRFSITLHLMRRGKIVYEPRNVLPKSAAAWMLFSDHSVLYVAEQGHKKRVRMYVMPRGKMIPHILSLGIDPLSDEFTVERLQDLLTTWRYQLRTFLRIQTIIAGIGNAYADEILWNAQLSPFQITGNLDSAQIARLYRSVQDTLLWAQQELRKRGVKEKRSFLHIHGHKGKCCPRCNSQIRTVSFADSEIYYCPLCQTQGTILKDRRMSKFYR